MSYVSLSQHPQHFFRIVCGLDFLHGFDDDPVLIDEIRRSLFDGVIGCLDSQFRISQQRKRKPVLFFKALVGSDGILTDTEDDCPLLQEKRIPFRKPAGLFRTSEVISLE